MKLHLTIGLVSLALSACAVGPNFKPPNTDPPPQWNAGTGTADASLKFSTAQAPDEWWREFHDDLLDLLIARAISANLDVRAATLRVAESRAKLEAATGGRWPSLNFDASYQRQRQSEFGSSTRLIGILAPPAGRDAVIQALSEPFDVYQAGFDAAWEIDLWGRVRRSVEAASATHRTTAEDLRDAQLSLTAEVTRNYLALRGAQQQLALTRTDIAASEETAKLTADRAAGGVITQLEVAAQSSRAADARSRLPTLEQQVVVLADALALLLGENPGALQSELSAAHALPALPTTIAVGVPTQIVRRRPDIRRAEARLQTATAQIGVAVADLYPRVTLTGSFANQSLNASDLNAWGARQWTIGPSLYLPIFDGSRLRSTVELRKLEQQEAAVNYQQTVLRAWHEVENALGSFTAELKRHGELTTLVASSEDAYQIARVRYEHGQTNYLAALDAQRTLVQAQRSLCDSDTQSRTQLVALYKALGGGWNETE